MTKLKFKERFKDYVCEGDTITTEVDYLTVTARIWRDYDSSIDDADCYSAIKRKQWRSDEWFFCGVALQVSHTETGVDLTGDYGAALWGIEANFNKRGNRYLSQVADELLPEAIAEANKALAKLQA